MSLKKYHEKRNFSITAEPKGGKSVTKKAKNKIAFDKDKAEYLYVIQKHAASHLHYDLRLEINGVLKSWAIPKGPHLNPSIKRLAVEVEDHPIEYGSFEGTIPEGQYGAGAVIVWDKGAWIPDNDPAQAYRKGELSFLIKGKKLKGRWQLVKIKDKTKNNSKKHWLFFKLQDKAAKKDYDIVESEPLSILTDQDVTEVGKSSKRVEKKLGSQSIPKTSTKIRKTTSDLKKK